MRIARKQRPAPAKLEAECDRLNKLHPIGSACRYWPGVREGEGKLSRTRSQFSILGGHTVVAWVEGRGDCIAATHLEFIEDAA